MQVQRRILILFITVLCFQACFSLTMKQLQKLFSNAKRRCMPKHNVTHEQVGNITKGDFREEPNVKCYVLCIYSSIHVIKEGRLDKGLVINQIDNMYPQDLQEPVKANVQYCEKVQDKYENSCDKAFYTAHCMYNKDPKNFIFA